jgi:hypothetical protein
MIIRLAASVTTTLLIAASASGQTAPSSAPGAGPHHRLDIRLDPASHRLTATDDVTWPGGASSGQRTFVLNAALTITRADPQVTEVPLAGALREVGL